MGGHEGGDTGVRDADSDAVDVFDRVWADRWDWDLRGVEPLGLGQRDFGSVWGYQNNNKGAPR